MLSTKKTETMLSIGFVLAASAVFLGGISCVVVCVKHNIVCLKQYDKQILLSMIVFAFIFESLMESNVIYDHYYTTTDDSAPQVFVLNDTYYQENTDVIQAAPNPEKFIHFIKTRFMQQQHNLTKLGKARIELFETFCLPSMIKQTRKDFFWYIETDPNLPDEILLPMKKLLAPYSDRFFLLLQNNYTKSPRQLDLDQITVASGNIDILRKAILDSKQKILLETTLEADDGLNINFGERIWNEVNTIYEDDKWKNTWRIFCPQRILNWYFGDLTSDRKYNNENGYLEDYKTSTERYCETSGRTYMLPPSVAIGSSLSYNKIRRRVKSCQNNNSVYESCRQDHMDDWFQTIRARTPSSTDMNGITLKVRQKHFNESTLWNSALKNFDVQESRVQSARQYLDVHMAEIAQENLDGQCNNDLTCKNDAGNTLKLIVEENKKNETATTEAPKFIHFIKTRFMQFQPNLIKLGKARLELFKTFCLPTIINQTNKDFFWYIQVDPNLSAEILFPMKKLLEPYSDRVFLLLQNGSPNPRDLHFDNMTVASGNVNILRKAILDSQVKTVIETRLDADDGLNVNFIENLRTELTSIYQPRWKKRRNYWRVFCARRILNWYFGDLTRDRTYINNNTKRKGKKRILSSPDGYLEDDKTSTKRFCVTPGLTVVYPPNVQAPRRLPHHKIRDKVKPCRKTVYENCRQYFSNDWFQAVRARTPSSAGMSGVTLKLPYIHIGGSELWNNVTQDFNVQKSRIQSLRQHFDVHMTEIAEENLVGHCIKGFTCRHFTVNSLKNILNANQNISTTM